MSDLLIGVDLGGTTVSVALARPDGQLVQSESMLTRSHDGPQAVLSRIADVVDSLCHKALGRPATGSAIGLGMGVPGLVDRETGTTQFLPNLPTQWRGIPVGDLLSERLGCPVRLLNDVRTATLGELRYGHGRDWPGVTLAFFSLGTGIGGGLAIDGKLRLGPLGSAGELGHQTILPDGPQCGCGNRGCLETLASGPAIAAEGIRLMKMGLAPKLYDRVDGNADRVTTLEMSMSDDPAIQDAVDKAAAYLGIAAANVVTIVHPDLIVLGGGVAEFGERLTVGVSKGIADRVGMFPTDQIRVQKSLLGDQAGVMGAIALAATIGEG